MFQGLPLQLPFRFASLLCTSKARLPLVGSLRYRRSSVSLSPVDGMETSGGLFLNEPFASST